MAKKTSSGGVIIIFIVVVALVVGGILISTPGKSTTSNPASGTPTVSEDPALINRADAATLGAKDAAVKVVVFSDFLCPYCKTLHSTIDTVLDANKSNVSETIRTFTIHPAADIMARAFEAANLQNKAREASDALFSGSYQTTADDMTKMATAIGLDLNKFQTDLNSSDTTAKLAKDNQDATALGLGGTPSVYINDKYISDTSTVEAQINQLLGK